MSTTGKQIKSPGKLNEKAAKIPRNLPRQNKDIPLNLPNYPQFRSVSVLNKRINEYLEKYTKETELYPNFAGLALFLGFREESEMYEYKESTRKAFADELKRGLLKIHELVVAAALRGNIGAIFYLKARGGSGAIKMQYLEKSVLEIESPPGISKEDQERLRKVSDLWERERRRELGAKVTEIGPTNPKSQAKAVS